MDATKSNYMISYFFTAPLLHTKEKYLNDLMLLLHTTDENAPEGNQPSFVNESTVGFTDSVTSEQLRDFEEHMRGLVTSAFSHFEAYCEANNEKSQLGLTVYVRDASGKTAAMFVNTHSDPPLVFGYYVDITTGTVLTDANVTFVESGKDMLHAILSYFNELSNATQQALH